MNNQKDRRMVDPGRKIERCPMTLREAGYRWELPEGSVLPFEEKLLASGLCDFALDMTFSTYRGIKRARYDCTGYVSIRELDLSSTEKLLEILEKTLITLHKAGEFFIERDKILLNGETVFYNTKYRHIKLAYYPRRQAVPLEEGIQIYLEELATLAGEQGKHYLSRLKKLFYENNSGLKDMLTAVGELRRGLDRGKREAVGASMSAVVPTHDKSKRPAISGLAAAGT